LNSDSFNPESRRRYHRMTLTTIKFPGTRSTMNSWNLCSTANADV